MSRVSRHWIVFALSALFAFMGMSPSAFAQGTKATVYFANGISQARYSAVSVRRVGEDTWQYSDYFAPLGYNDTSNAFFLEDGDYEYVMSVAQRYYLTEIEGSFSILGGHVENLTSNARSGAEIQTNATGESLIIAGDAVETVEKKANSVFFKVLQPTGLSPEQIENGVAFFTNRGVKMGVYNYSSSGSVSVLLPGSIQNGRDSVSQTYYTYEVNIPGYSVAKGTVRDLSGSSYATRYTWEEDPDFKAEKINISQTSGYQVYLAPAQKGTKTISFAIISGNDSAEPVLKNAAGETVNPSAQDQYAIEIPQEGSTQYFYTISAEHYVTVNGSFQIDSEGNVIDLTTDAEKQNALTYSYGNTTYEIQMIPRTYISRLVANPDGTYTVPFPSDSFEDGWYPGLGKEGRFTITNDTENEYAIIGYDVVIQHSNGDYRMESILRAANKAVCDLYGWTGREESTLAGLVHVEDKIREVYENNPEYCQSYQFTYSDYLLYYYKTKYPDQYASIQSLSELSQAHQYEIFAQYNSTDDCWYDDGPGDSFGAIDPEEAFADGSVYSYQSGAKYGALELDHEVDQLAKAIAFDDGFLYSFDTTITPVREAPSLFDWAGKTEKAQTAFEAFAQKAVLSPGKDLRLNHLGFQLVGGAFSNCFQAVEWDYTVSLILQNKEELKRYHVTYQFVNGTDQGSLPPEVMQLLPVDDQTYLPGSTVVAKEVSNITVEDAKGQWVFHGWDRLVESGVQSDVVFTGIWVYLANQQPPVTGDEDGEQDGDVPSDKPVDMGKIEEVPKTGDESRPALWSAVALCSLCGLSGLVVLRKKETHKR